VTLYTSQKRKKNCSRLVGEQESHLALSLLIHGKTKPLIAVVSLLRLNQPTYSFNHLLLIVIKGPSLLTVAAAYNLKKERKKKTSFQIQAFKIFNLEFEKGR
jgi:hypothetical protein